MSASSSSNSSSGTVAERNIIQTGRLLQVTTTLGPNIVGLEAFSGTEELSKPFEFHLRLVSYKNDIDCASLLRSAVTVKIALPDGTFRSLNGIFSRFSQGHTTSQDFFIYEAVMVPKIWLLSLYQDCKIFQSMTVPAIVQQVLGNYSITLSMNAQGDFPTRDYCVQYRETTLDFLSRILEEEGIYYYFAHTDTAHTITFANASSSATACANLPANVIYTGYEKHGPGGTGIYSLTRIDQATTQKVTLWDYDFENPTTNATGTFPGSGSEEVYDYPGDDSNNSGESGKRSTARTFYAKMRGQELLTFGRVIEGESDLAGFQAGFKFTLEKHFRSDVNAAYFLVSVTHDATDTTIRSTEMQAGSYSNHYRAIPLATPYRPPRITPKPKLTGPQTALVVGNQGDEITVDQYGRVKVQFYWDRVGTKDQNSSCWIRVAQIWAGKNWGWITIPRIGQEVIVSFLEGDPDRPIITGRVYNADQKVPYTLPANKTQSGIRSRSSSGGETANYNELQFEDNKGSEKITFHAEKDMLTEVEHDDTQSVTNDRTITVKGKHTETITKDTSITIEQGNHSLDVQTGNHSIKVDTGNHSMTVSTGNHSVEVDLGNQSVKVNAGSQSTFVMQGITHESVESITLTVGDSSIQITPTNINLSAPMINISAEGIGALSGAVVQIEGDITLIN